MPSTARAASPSAAKPEGSGDMTENLIETQLSSRDIFDGRILHVKYDTVRLPNGGEASRELIRHVGAVYVLPLTADGRVVVERQFRYPMNEVITEIPAGKLDSPEEDPFEAVKRELREETGATADSWTCLGPFYPAAAYSDERIWMYLAENLHFGQRELDEDEFLDVELVPLETLVEQVLAGQIPDAKTQTAVMRVWAMKNR